MHGISTWPLICKAKLGFHFWVLGIHCAFYSDHCIWLLRASTCVTSFQESPDPSFSNKRPFSVLPGLHCPFHSELITPFFAFLSVLPGKTGVQFRTEYLDPAQVWQSTQWLFKQMDVCMDEWGSRWAPSGSYIMGGKQNHGITAGETSLGVRMPRGSKFPVTLVLNPGQPPKKPEPWVEGGFWLTFHSLFYADLLVALSCLEFTLGK